MPCFAGQVLRTSGGNMNNKDRNGKKQVVAEPLEKRATYRLSVNLGVFIRLAGDGSFPPQAIYREDELTPWEAVETNNLSETGLSVNSRTGYEKNTCLQIIIQLENNHGMELIYLLGIVRRAEMFKSMRRRCYNLGIEFLPYEEKTRRRIAKFTFMKQAYAIRVKKNAQFKN